MEGNVRRLISGSCPSRGWFLLIFGVFSYYNVSCWYAVHHGVRNSAPRPKQVCSPGKIQLLGEWMLHALILALILALCNRLFLHDQPLIHISLLRPGWVNPACSHSCTYMPIHAWLSEFKRRRTHWLSIKIQARIFQMDVLNTSRTGKRNQSASIWCVL